VALSALGEYVPSHKTWDHVGDFTPIVEYSEGAPGTSEMNDYIIEVLIPYTHVRVGDILTLSSAGHLLAFEPEYHVPEENPVMGKVIGVEVQTGQPEATRVLLTLELNHDGREGLVNGDIQHLDIHQILKSTRTPGKKRNRFKMMAERKRRASNSQRRRDS